MKRKVTNLEQYLYDNGYKLSHKTYQGKYSQFTKEYVFSKMANNDIYRIDICLDKKRQKVTHYGITYIGFIEYTMAMQIMASLDSVKEMLAKYE